MMAILLSFVLLWGASCTAESNSYRAAKGDVSLTSHFESFANCCPDFDAIYSSCEARCGTEYLPSVPCQCNRDCKNYNNCCKDYDAVCSSEVTDAEWTALTEQLYQLDRTFLVGHFITYDPNPPGPLFTEVDPEAFNSPTISTFLALRDNYYPISSELESDDPQESAEKNAFLEAVMATDVMKRTEQFLIDNGMITKSLKEVIDEIWFTRYPRYQDILGSSGFEHSFLGEIDDGQVKGFHNWISFYEDEKNGEIEYTKYIDEEDIDQENLDLYAMGFDWQGFTKSTSSMYIGSTPELELALYTLCFYYKPNSHCDISMNGVKSSIQTYIQNYNGGKYVGSAYPEIRS